MAHRNSTIDDVNVLVREGQMDEPALIELPGGTAAVFSTPRPGATRPNQDVAAVLPVGDRGAVLAVADGAGGSRAGGSAAALAVRELTAAIERAESAGAPLRGAVLDGIESANRAVIELGVGAATTIAVMVIEDGRARTFHVGDSILFVVGQRGRAKLRTLPHGPTGYALHAGLMNETEAMHHSERHLVTNLVGDPEMRIDLGSPLVLAPHDTALVASDGLADNLFPDEIAEHIRRGPLEESSRLLVATCRRRMLDSSALRPSCPDDATFILFRQTKPALRSRANAAR